MGHLFGSQIHRDGHVGVLDQLFDGGLQLTALLRQADDGAAAVDLAVVADDQVLVLQPGHEAGDGGGVQPQLLRQLGGGLLILAPETLQQGILNGRHIVLLEFLFKVGVNGILRVGQQKVDTVRQFHLNLYLCYSIDYTII